MWIFQSKVFKHTWNFFSGPSNLLHARVKRKLKLPSTHQYWKRNPILPEILPWLCWKMTKNRWWKNWVKIQIPVIWMKFQNCWIRPVHYWRGIVIYALVWPLKSRGLTVKKPLKPLSFCPKMKKKKWWRLLVIAAAVTNVTLLKKNLCPVWNPLSIHFQGEWLF